MKLLYLPFLCLLLTWLPTSDLSANNVHKTMDEVNYFTGLLDLMGKSKYDVDITIGQPPNQTLLEGEIEILKYPGVDLYFKNDVLSQIWFAKNPETGSFDYHHPIFAGINFAGKTQSMKFSIELVMRFIGPYQFREETTRYDYNLFEDVTKTFYYWLDKELIMTFEGSVQSMVIKSRRAADLLINSQKNASNVANLVYLLNDKANWLNKPETKLEELLGSPDYEPSVNGDSKDFYYVNLGLVMTYSVSNELFMAISLVRKDENFEQYPHALPFGLQWNTTVDSSKALCGNESEVVDQGGYHILVFEDKGLAIYFDSSTQSIARVQLFAASKELLLLNDNF